MKIHSRDQQDNALISLVGKTIKSEKNMIDKLPYSASNCPTFNQIDELTSLIPEQGIKHKQEETSFFVMVEGKKQKKTAREEQIITIVKNTGKDVGIFHKGITGFDKKGHIAPIDYGDIQQVLEKLK